MDSEPKTTHYVIFVSRVTHMHVTRMFSVQSHVSFLSPVSVFLLSQVFYIKIDDNSISIATLVTSTLLLRLRVYVQDG